MKSTSWIKSKEHSISQEVSFYSIPIVILTLKNQYLGSIGKLKDNFLEISDQSLQGYFLGQFRIKPSLASSCDLRTTIKIQAKAHYLLFQFWNNTKEMIRVQLKIM